MYWRLQRICEILIDWDDTSWWQQLLSSPLIKAACHSLAMMTTVLSGRRDVSSEADKLRAMIIMLRQEKEVRDTSWRNMGYFDIKVCSESCSASLEAPSLFSFCRLVDPYLMENAIVGESFCPMAAESSICVVKLFIVTADFSFCKNTSLIRGY